MRSLTEIIVPRYVANETDFASALSRQSQALQDLVQTEVIAPLADAEVVPEAGKFCVVDVIGHGDRVDIAGMSAEDRRALELTNTRARAESAAQFIFDQMVDLVQTAGGTIPAGFADMTNSAIAPFAAGAADLVHTRPANEDQRQDNRRVVFFVAKFEPEIVTP